MEGQFGKTTKKILLSGHAECGQKFTYIGCLHFDFSCSIILWKISWDEMLYSQNVLNFLQEKFTFLQIIKGATLPYE